MARKKAQVRGSNRRRWPNEPFVVVYAQKPGGPLLKYIGRGKFARRGSPRFFEDLASANLAAWMLKDMFPVELKGYKLFAK